jgi:hypothetical protein
MSGVERAVAVIGFAGLFAILIWVGFVWLSAAMGGLGPSPVSLGSANQGLAGRPSKSPNAKPPFGAAFLLGSTVLSHAPGKKSEPLTGRSARP